MTNQVDDVDGKGQNMRGCIAQKTPAKQAKEDTAAHVDPGGNDGIPEHDPVELLSVDIGVTDIADGVKNDIEPKHQK